MRPELPGGLLPVFVLDRYEGLEPRLLQDFSEDECARYVEANAAALRELAPADLVFANHVLMGAPVGAASGLPFRVKAHGSELEYSMRGRPRLEEWGRESLAGAEATYVGSEHIREVLEEVVGRVEPVFEVPPGVDVERVRAASRATRRSPACSTEARARPAEPGQRERAAAGRGQRRRGSRRSSPADEPIVVYFGKLIENKGVHLLLEALRGLDARAVVVGFGDYRARRSRRRRARCPRATLFTGPLEHRHLVHLLPLADVAVVPSIFPEAFGMVAAEAAAGGCPPLVARHSGLAEVAAGLEEEYPPAPAPPRRVRERRRRRPAREARGSSSRSRPTSATRCARRPRRAVVARWSWTSVASACSRPSDRPVPAQRARVTSAAMGEEQKLSPDEQLAFARDAFEDGIDFTVAVEEEFALLDPETLGLVDRFEDLQAAARGTELEPHLVGELIASEVEVRTGRCVDFGEAAAKMAERRAQLQALAREQGVQLGATGTHPWARWQDQRIIDTPHYRRNNELLHYVVWRNNTFGLHVHVGIQGGDRAIAVCNAMRRFLPELLALSASSPFVEEVDTGLHSARTQIFTRMFPRCGIPDAYDGWQGFEDYVAFLYRTGSITEHTQLWWSVRPHLAYPTVEIRICDAQPDLAESQSLAALIVRARRALRARPRRGRAAARPAAPAARGEHVARDPLRPLGRADRLRPRRARPGARAARAADRVGRAGRRRDRRRAVPRRPGRERGRAAARALAGGRVARADLRRAGRAGERIG